MSDVNREQPLHTEGVIADYFTIESKILTTRTADAFKAYQNSNQRGIFIWILRYPLPLNSDAVKAFLRRMQDIDDIDPILTQMEGYGVDKEGRAFSIFPVLDGFKVTAGNISIREAERRFVSCVRVIERMHSNGIVSGDICSDSFWVGRNGEVQLVGVMGSFDTEAAKTAIAPPQETLFYLAPEQRSGGGAEFASDVFALGVLAYFLLTGEYPFNSPQDMEIKAPVSSIISSPPVWADVVLEKALSIDPQQRYADASELMEGIKEVRSRIFSQDLSPATQSTALKLKDQDRLESFENLDLTGKGVIKDDMVESRDKQGSREALVVWVMVGILAVLLGVVIYLVKPYFMASGHSGGVQKISKNLKEELQIHRDVIVDKQLKTAIDIIADPDAGLKIKAKQIEKIAASNDPLAHEILVKTAVESQDEQFRHIVEQNILKRARRLGLIRSVEQVKQWLRVNAGSSIPSGYEFMLKALDRSLPMESLASYLRRAYAVNPRAALKLSVALFLDMGQEKESSIVVRQLIGDSLKLTDAENRSIYSLILVHPELSLLFGEDVIQSIDNIPDRDISWLLGKLAERNDVNIRAIANLALKRQILPKTKEVFLKIIRDKGGVPPDVLTSLTKAAAGTITSNDIDVFGRWYDVDSEKVLLAILASYDNEAILKDALDTLFGKSLTIEPALSLVEWVKKKHWSDRYRFAKVIGYFGNLDKITIEQMNKELNVFNDVVKDSKLISILLKSNNPKIIKTVLKEYKEFIDVGSLLNLLASNNKEVKLLAINALKDTNDLGALKIIIDFYEREKDPEIKKAFEDNFWVIKDRIK